MDGRTVTISKHLLVSIKFAATYHRDGEKSTAMTLISSWRNIYNWCNQSPPRAFSVRHYGHEKHQLMYRDWEGGQPMIYLPPRRRRFWQTDIERHFQSLIITDQIIILHMYKQIHLQGVVSPKPYTQNTGISQCWVVL